LGIEVDLSLPAQRVIRALDQIIEWRGKLASIRYDNGPEYISQSLVDWASQNQIALIDIQPGKPTQNAYIERVNRTARHEWLDLHEFNSVPHIQLLVTQWLGEYNNERPNTTMGGVLQPSCYRLHNPLLKWPVKNGGLQGGKFVKNDINTRTVISRGS
jgi:putative transposase